MNDVMTQKMECRKKMIQVLSVAGDGVRRQ